MDKHARQKLMGWKQPVGKPSPRRSGEDEEDGGRKKGEWERQDRHVSRRDHEVGGAVRRSIFREMEIMRIEGNPVGLPRHIGDHPVGPNLRNETTPNKLAIRMNLHGIIGNGEMQTNGMGGMILKYGARAGYLWGTTGRRGATGGPKGNQRSLKKTGKT